jgi:hypothetical protein
MVFNEFGKEMDWIGEEGKATLCYTFDDEKFPIGNPGAANDKLCRVMLLGREGSLLDKFNLERTVIDTVTIVSCEIVVGAESASTKPFLLYVTLQDQTGKLIPHDILSACGHPIGPGCNALAYSTHPVPNISELNHLIKIFGNFSSPGMFEFLSGQYLNHTPKTQANKAQFRHLHTVARSYDTSTHPATEKPVENMTFDKEELKSLQTRIDPLLTTVNAMFYDISNIKACVSVSANEVSVQDDTKAKLLVRLVIEVRFRAALKLTDA